MDDTTKISNNQYPISTVQTTTQPVAQENAGQVLQQEQPFDQAQGEQAVQTVSVLPGKESAPIAISKPQEQWVSETAPEATVSKELQEAGVEASKGEVLHVSQDVANAGVVPTGTAVPVPQEPTLNLPITEEKAKGILKMHKKVRESITWLAMLIIRQVQQIQFKQRKEKK